MFEGLVVPLALLFAGPLPVVGGDVQPKESHVIVEGQVTDAFGLGQEGVTITVRRKNPDGSKGEVVASAGTDEMGDFVVRAGERPRGEVIVTISKTHYADLVRELVLGEDEPPFLGETLVGSLTVSGAVRDALEGRPIGGARVVLESGADRLRATTDEQGRFSIAGLSPGEAELVVEADGFGRERVTIAQVEGQANRDVSLKPQRIVHIKVVDDEDKPIRGVVVECLDQPRGDLRRNITGDDGAATVTGIHFDAATLAIRLTHRDYVSGTSFDRQVTLPPSDNESTHTVTMSRAGAITGRITSARDGKGVHSARVLVGEEYSDSAPRDYSDSEGRYTVRGVRPGAAVVTIHLSGYAPELKIVEVKPGDVVTLDISLTAGKVLEGVVRTEQGDPVADAEVVAVTWRGKSTLGLRAMTDKQGKFRMEDAPEDAFEVTVGGVGDELVTQTVRAGDSPIEIKLPAGALQGPKRKGVLEVGETVPKLSVRTMNGESLDLVELQGKTILVDFWATWCLPCIEELPHFMAVQEKYGARNDFMIIGISRDHETELVREHLRRNTGITWRQAVGAAAGVPQAVDAFGVDALPEVFLIGPDGKIIANNLRGERIRQAVETAMKPGG